MKFQIRDANRADLLNILSFMGGSEPVICKQLINRFDDILCQTNHHVLLAEADGKIVGTLCISIIDGIGNGFPLAAAGGGKILPEFSKKGVDRALISRAKMIAAESGCREII